MILGAHEPISGGVYKCFSFAREDGCKSIQIFNKSNNRWYAKKLSEKEIKLFKEERKRLNNIAVVSHTSYLINLASPNEELWRKSIDSFAEELMRCELLGIEFLVFHPGSHTGLGEKEGLKRVIEGLTQAVEKSNTKKVKCIFETTAGQGTNLGYTFEQIGELVRNFPYSKRKGVCIDTAHIFAAGYDIRTQIAYDKTKKQIDKYIGLEHVMVFHLNDSKFDLGTRKDRHEHIGKGYIGKKGFAILLNDTTWEDIPGILETPPLSKTSRGYKENLEVLYSLLE